MLHFVTIYLHFIQKNISINGIFPLVLFSMCLLFLPSIVIKRLCIMQLRITQLTSINFAYEQCIFSFSNLLHVPNIYMYYSLSTLHQPDCQFVKFCQVNSSTVPKSHFLVENLTIIHCKDKPLFKSTLFCLYIICVCVSPARYIYTYLLQAHIRNRVQRSFVHRCVVLVRCRSYMIFNFTCQCICVRAFFHNLPCILSFLHFKFNKVHPTLYILTKPLSV